MKTIRNWLKRKLPLLCFMDYWIVFYVLLMAGIAIASVVLEIKLD